MNDLISRQALLNKFEPWLKVKDYSDGELNMLKAILYEIRFMPSATDKNVGTKLSTNLAQVGTDCISRQQAIDALDDIESEVADGGGFQYEKWRKYFCELPSAQPEIVRCKDCKWCEDADGLMCKNTASWVVATDYDFGCVLAERRQDG